MTEFLIAVAMAIAIEGMLYALFPQGMRRMMAIVLTYAPEKLRLFGLVMAMVGVGLVWLIKSAG